MAKRSRRWLLRLAQSSPLVAVAVFAALWFSVPAYMTPFLITFSSAGTQITPQMRSSWIESEATAKAAREADLWGKPTSLQERIEGAWELTIERQDEYVSTTTVTPLPFAADDAIFAPLREWEDSSGGRVWAWTLIGTEPPPVIASAMGEKTSLETLKRDFEQMAELQEPGFTAPVDLVEHVWRGGAVTNGAIEPVDAQRFRAGGGGGGGGGSYWTSNSTISEGGELWYVAVVEKGDVDEQDMGAAPKGMDGVDPRSDGYGDLLARIAKRDEANIWVFGPLDSETVPLRVPPGQDPERAAELGEALWPELAARTTNFGGLGLETLTPTEQRLAGGKVAAMSTASLWTTQLGSSMGMYTADEIAPQSVLYVAVFDEMPGGAPSRLERAWTAWRRFVTGWFPWLVGGALGLLALTLVISPTAFVFERRRAARLRVRQEMERMQRDAHDKVYNRLSALSKRVAAAGDAATTELSSSLGDIAADIRQTVGELQEILGEEVHHTDAVLTSLPLSAQIASVCAAQAPRLGAQVTCEAPEPLPTVSPRLGWDLQCVAEEAITNAVRHGGATHVTVSLSVDPPGSLALVVVDDGSGSSVLRAQDAAPDSTGLKGMGERLAAHGGKLEIVAGTLGTSVTARVPLG